MTGTGMGSKIAQTLALSLICCAFGVVGCDGSELAAESDGTVEPDTVDPDVEPDTSELDTGEADTAEPDTDAPDTAPTDTGPEDTAEPDTVAPPDTTDLDTEPMDVPGDTSPDPVDTTEDTTLDTSPAPCVTDSDCDDMEATSCQTAFCDVASGECLLADANEGQPCEDGDLCTTDETCSAGTCVPQNPVVCADTNGCTDDFCDPAVGCVFQNNFAPCDDGDACTVDDTCAAGVCTTGVPKCDDDNPCTTDSCGAGGICTFAPDDAATCSDGSACTVGDACSGGVCLPGAADGCDDANPCTADDCSEDGLTCEHELLTEVPCDDDDVCTVDDMCVSGTCTGGGPFDCGGDPGCISWECDPIMGCSLVEIFDGVACNDGDQCTDMDVCDATGVCLAGSPRDCDDNNSCTEDDCEPATGCTHVTTPGPCDDNNACTTGDTCLGVLCRGDAVSCDDGNACTADTCDPFVGCESVDTTASCDDGNPCTDDSCDTFAGCLNVPNTLACDDGALCTINDVCNDGVCVGVVDTCDDGDPCTSDICDAEEGCGNFGFEGPCEDGDLCTEGETCSAGTTCVGGVAVDPDDGIPCTLDSCDSALGVSNVADHDSCALGEECDLVNGCTAITPEIVLTKFVWDPGLGTDETGRGQWVQYTNVTNATFDLTGFELRSTANQLTVPITPQGTGPLLIGPGESIEGMKNSMTAGPNAASFDFLFGSPNDNFGFKLTGDGIVLQDADGTLIDAVTVNPISLGPVISISQFPLASTLATEFDATKLAGAVNDSANNSARDWCVHPTIGTPSAAPRSCTRGRINEVSLGGVDGARWVEVHLPAGGLTSGMVIRVVAPGGGVVSDVPIGGRMPLQQALVVTDGVGNVSLPMLQSGAVQLVRGLELLDVYGFGTLTGTGDSILNHPLFEGTPGPAQSGTDSASRLMDGVDTDDNSADFSTSSGGSPGDLNSP